MAIQCPVIFVQVLSHLSTYRIGPKTQRFCHFARFGWGGGCENSHNFSWLFFWPSRHTLQFLLSLGVRGIRVTPASGVFCPNTPDALSFSSAWKMVGYFLPARNMRCDFE